MLITDSNDLKEVSECLLFKSGRRHTFCDNCWYEPVIPGEQKCPLCRRFFKIPLCAFGGISRKHFLGKLINLHSMYLEKSELDDKVFDVPVLSNFEIKDFIHNQKRSEIFRMTWFENRIYFVCNTSKKVRVFSDKAPFEESSDSFEINGLKKCSDVEASAASRSIFISDTTAKCFWKLQMPDGVTSQWITDRFPCRMSISSDELVAVMARYINVEDDDHSLEPNYSIYIYKAADVIRMRTVVLSRDIKELSCAVKLPNNNFIIAYSTVSNPSVSLISELSADGAEYLKTFDLRLVAPEPIAVGSLKPFRTWVWYPQHLTVDGDGKIFVTDFFADRVFVLNPQFSGYQIILNKGHRFGKPLKTFLYKSQMIVAEMSGFRLGFSLFNLSPCNMVEK